MDQSGWGSTSVSNEYAGYFHASAAGIYTFTFVTSNDSYMWLGSSALSGYDNTNAFINTSGHNSLVSISSSITLGADTYTPLRVQWGANGISGNFTSTVYSPAILSGAVQHLDNYLFHLSPTTGF